mmetsp:Transcript_61162/g.178768  ORF Transcript_61162/g.178768 Transcript_61162/m.178768 type:complete len:261 (+) Transcript_61162:162-944(+)
MHVHGASSLTWHHVRACSDTYVPFFMAILRQAKFSRRAASLLLPRLASTVATAHSSRPNTSFASSPLGSGAGGAPEARRYCRVPSRSTRAPPQKPEGGQGGTRRRAAMRSCRKPSTVCTSCMSRRFGARPARRVSTERDAKFSNTAATKFSSSHGLGSVAQLTSRGPTRCHWLGNTTNSAHRWTKKTCSSTHSPKRENATLMTELCKAKANVDPRTSKMPMAKLLAPAVLSDRAAADCIALPAHTMPTVTIPAPVTCEAE